MISIDKEELPFNIDDPKLVSLLPPLKEIIVRYLIIPEVIEDSENINLESVLWFRSLGLCFVPKPEDLDDKDKVKIFLDDISLANRAILSAAPKKGNMELMIWLHDQKYYLLNEAKGCIRDSDFRAICREGNLKLLEIISGNFTTSDFKALRGNLLIDICVSKNVQVAEFIWEKCGFGIGYDHSSRKTVPTTGLIRQMKKYLNKDNPITEWLKSKLE